MVHFSPLNGDPAYPGEKILFDRALADIHALQNGGVDAIMFENNFDNPKFEILPKEQAESFSLLVERLLPKVKLPWGVSALWNDYRLALSLCQKFGGVMVRVPVFADQVETVYGIFDGHPEDVLSFRSSIGADHVKIYVDVQVKHARLTQPRPLAESIADTVSYPIDGIILTGSWTGDPPSVEDCQLARSLAPRHMEVLTGSGMTSENIGAFLPYMQGCIIGTAFKEVKGPQKSGPNVVGPEVRYDPERVQGFMQKIRWHT